MLATVCERSKAKLKQTNNQTKETVIQANDCELGGSSKCCEGCFLSIR